MVGHFFLFRLGDRSSRGPSQVKKPAGDERKGEWKILEIDGENVLRIFLGLLAESVASIASHKPCRLQRKGGVQDGDVDVHDVLLRARFGGITQGASAFSAGTESSRGR